VVDGADAEGWSQVAEGWSRLWGLSARPAQEALAAAAGVTAGTRVLDVGCGGGEFLGLLRDLGARPVGVDPAGGMRRLSAARGFEVHAGDAENLPFAAGSFDAVAAVNALQFADDIPAALAEFARVLAPGGRVAIANWAEAAENDLDTIEQAVARADEVDALPDDPLRLPGGLEAALTAAGLEVTASGMVDTPWRAADDDALVTGVLLGADPAFVAEMRPVVLAAAEPFRDAEGYLLRNRYRWSVGTVRR
jgi:SAM-dependent methyltransferase